MREWIGEACLEVCERCNQRDCVMPEDAWTEGEPAICCVCDPTGWPVHVEAWA